MIDSTGDFLHTLANVLLRCWVFGFVLLLITFAAYFLAGGFIDNVHGKLFGLSPHELDLIFYCWMGALKLLVLVFFFAPWLAIRWELRGK